MKKASRLGLWLDLQSSSALALNSLTLRHLLIVYYHHNGGGLTGRDMWALPRAHK